MKIISNSQRRPLRCYLELPEKVRLSGDFAYIDEEQTHDPRFFYYKGNYYDTGDCEFPGTPEQNPFSRWDGYFSETFFSGIVFKFDRETMQSYDFVIVGRYST